MAKLRVSALGAVVVLSCAGCRSERRQPMQQQLFANLSHLSQLARSFGSDRPPSVSCVAASRFGCVGWCGRTLV